MTLRTFSYVALSRTGLKSRGTLGADSAAAAASLLRARELTPLRLREMSAATPVGALRPRLKATDLAELLFALGRLLRGGANLRGALGVLGAPNAPRRQREVCAELQELVGGGRPLAEAFREVLGPRAGAVPALIAAGERGGELPQALEAAAQLIRRDLEIRAKVVAAISYPAFLCVAFAGALAMLILVVAPSLAPLMSEAGGSPPLVLTLLIGANAVLTQHGAAIGILLAATTAALALGARAKLFTAAWEVIVIDGPLHGVSRRLLYGQAATVIGRLMAAGAPAPEALRLGAAVVGNGLARRRLEGAAAAVFAGAPLSAALAGCQGFPPEVLRMAQLGEGAGELGAMLQNAGELAQAGALQWVDRLSKWLGPALIVGLGTMVGGMMASLLTALNTLGANALN